MLNEHSRTISFLSVVTDAVLLAGACAAAGAYAADGQASALPASNMYTFGAISSGLFVLMGLRRNIYESRRTDTLIEELFEVLALLTTAMGSATIFCSFLKVDIFGQYLQRAWVLALTLVPGFRLMLRSFLRMIRRRGYNFRTVLLVGNNARTERILDGILENEHFGIRVRGILDTQGALSTSSPSPQIPHLGSLSRLRELLTDPSHPIDEVICTLPLRSHYSQTEEVVRTCEEIGISVKIASDLFDANVAKTAISWFGGDVPLVTYFSGPSCSLRLAVKRMIDIIGSSACVLAVSPVLVLSALAVRLTSRGPILFRQIRVGLHGKQFMLYKFRSMVVDAEARLEELRAKNEMTGPVFKLKNDPRITRVGRFIRRWSIDELPQLFNVLKGDMSLVGPRPPVPSEVEKYEWWQRRRLSMKPGITCIWQVSGRNQIREFAKWMELDLRYIDNWSLWLDCKLLLRTIPAVLGKNGAS
jgi:exopolysaccharide biosynthesis polyprenyl glycosylphosphotransferase